MSTKSDQNQPDEDQEREVMDVIEVPPARSDPAGGEDKTSATSDTDEETAPDNEIATKTEGDSSIEPEADGTSGPSEESPEVDVDEDGSVEIEDEVEDEVVEESDSESSSRSNPPARFKCAITGGTLKSVLSTIGAIVDETRIHIDEDGLRMRAVDPANVAMDDLEVDAAAFDAYDATPGVIAVDLDRFSDIIKLAKADDLVQIALDLETRKLVIHVVGLEFTMACLAPDSLRAEPDMPDLDLPAVVTVARSALDRGMKAADMVSDHVSIQVDAATERFLVTAEGDTDEVSFEFDGDDIEFESVADTEAWFSLDYMKKLVKSTPNSAKVTMRIGTDFPLVMAYDLADGNGHATRMLAPRIRSN